MAACVAYLASSDGSYVTGETIVVAGGMPSKLYPLAKVSSQDTHQYDWVYPAVEWSNLN